MDSLPHGIHLFRESFHDKIFPSFIRYGLIVSNKRPHYYPIKTWRIHKMKKLNL